MQATFVIGHVEMKLELQDQQRRRPYSLLKELVEASFDERYAAAG